MAGIDLEVEARQTLHIAWAYAKSVLAYPSAEAVRSIFLVISTLIMRGELDMYLSLLKPALPHILLSRVNVANLGRWPSRLA